MSGSGNIGFGLNLLPVFTDVLPGEGSKVCSIKVQWASTFTTPPNGVVNINLLQQFQTNQFQAIQSVYIDNTTCPFQVSLTCNETGMKVIIPPFTMGMYPLLASQSPTFLAQLFYTADPISGTIQYQCTTSFFFLNTPQNRFQYSLPAHGNNSGNFSNGLAFVNPANASQPLDHWNYLTGIPILPSPQPANQHWLITAVQATVVQYGYYGSVGSPRPTGELGILMIGEDSTGNNTGIVNVAPNWLRWMLQFPTGVPTGAEVDPSYQATIAAISTTFDPPIMSSIPSSGMILAYQGFMPDVGQLPDGTGAMLIGITVCYGTVTIL